MLGNGVAITCRECGMPLKLDEASNGSCDCGKAWIEAKGDAGIKVEPDGSISIFGGRSK